jgi:hypothetical protein
MYREFLIEEPDELGDQAQIALVRSEGGLGAIIDRALEIMDNAVGCQQEGLSLERCTGVNSGVGAVGAAEALCFSKT